MRSFTIIKTILFIVLFSGLGSDAGAQEKGKALKDLLDSRHFTFKARTMMPTGRGARQLTSDYDLTIKGDTVVAYLPYFGRAYAPVLPGEGGIDFTSTHFTYKIREKKDEWLVTIQPKDTRDVRQLYLTIQDNGYAQLQVNSNNRQPISYSGQIEKPDR